MWCELKRNKEPWLPLLSLPVDNRLCKERQITPSQVFNSLIFKMKA